VISLSTTLTLAPLGSLGPLQYLPWPCMSDKPGQVYVNLSAVPASLV